MRIDLDHLTWNDNQIEIIILNLRKVKPEKILSKTLHKETSKVCHAYDNGDLFSIHTSALPFVASSCDTIDFLTR